MPRDDVSLTPRLKEEGNEHFCGSWRMILWEFNMEPLIRIVQKNIIKLQDIFSSGLVMSRSNSSFKGYQLSFPDFIESEKSRNKSEETCRPVYVDL